MTVRPIHVLLVEDNPGDVRIVREMARSVPGIEIHQVDRLAAGIEQLAVRPWDVVLVDLGLPDSQGLATLRAILTTGCAAPVVVLTGQDDEAVGHAAVREGAQDYLVKGRVAEYALIRALRYAIERGQAQAKLQASERRYRRLFETAKDGILILDPATGSIVDVNPFLTQLTGFSREDFLDKHLWEIGPFKDNEGSRASFAELQAREYVRYDDLPLRTRDGRTIDVEFVSNVYRADDKNVIQCNVRDITARKRAEEDLRFKNVILSSQMEASIDGILIVDVNGKRVSGNRRFGEMWGLPLEMIESGSDGLVLQWVSGQVADPKGFISRYQHLYATPEEMGRDEIALKDGRTFEGSTAPMFDAAGKHFGRVWNFRDISSHKQAEETLRQSEQRFRALFERAADCIMLLEITPDGTVLIRDANAATTRLLGYVRSELIDRPISVIHEGPDLREVLEDRRETALSGLQKTFEVKHRCKDGRLLDFESCSTEMRIGTKVFAMSVSRDVTARKLADKERAKLQEQLRVAQKMEAIGSLAGGVAHDFNNLLSVVLSYTSLVLDGLGEAHPMRDDLLEVKKAADRGAALTRQLLAFSRKQVLQPVVLSLNLVVEGVEKMLRRVLREDIDLHQVLAPDLGLTLADPGQIEQVIMNLAVNARDAMPAGGKLTIETSNVRVDAEYAARHVGVVPGPYVLLAVSDTGCGMDEQTRARIFEPFFTTKEKGKGTGLGLSTVYGIVEQSGGNVWVYSEPGQGTTFKVYLPRDLSGSPATSIKPPSPPKRSTGTETILVVEDEEALRNVAKRTLDAAGYTVLVAAGGDEALLASAHHTGRIHLLVTDVVMPRMGGRALAHELAKMRPGTKVLYMSGYTDDAIIHHGVLAAGTHFLGKPFTTTDLTRKVREVLDSTVTHRSGEYVRVIEVEPPTSERPLDVDALRSLSPDVASKLRSALIAARSDEIVETVETLRAAHPRVATGLRRMADRFDYDGMLNLLREGNEQGDGR